MLNIYNLSYLVCLALIVYPTNKASNIPVAVFNMHRSDFFKKLLASYVFGSLPVEVVASFVKFYLLHCFVAGFRHYACNKEELSTLLGANALKLLDMLAWLQAATSSREQLNLKISYYSKQILCFRRMPAALAILKRPLPIESQLCNK